MYCTAIFYLNAEKGKIVHCKMPVLLEAVSWLPKMILKITETDRRIDNGKSGKTT